MSILHLWLEMARSWYSPGGTVLYSPGGTVLYYLRYSSVLQESRYSIFF